MMWEKQRKGWRMSCDVGKVTERLENELRMAELHLWWRDHKDDTIVNFMP